MRSLGLDSELKHSISKLIVGETSKETGENDYSATNLYLNSHCIMVWAGGM